jgi:hypothetical protein
MEQQAYTHAATRQRRSAAISTQSAQLTQSSHRYKFTAPRLTHAREVEQKAVSRRRELPRADAIKSRRRDTTIRSCWPISSIATPLPATRHTSHLLPPRHHTRQLRRPPQHAAPVAFPPPQVPATTNTFKYRSVAAWFFPERMAMSFIGAEGFRWLMR